MNYPDALISEIFRRDRNFAQHLIDDAPIIVLLLSIEGEIQFVNKHFTALTGYPLEEIHGKDWFEGFLPAQDQDRVRKLFETATGGTPTRGNVTPIVTRTGTQLQIEWSDTLIHDADGQIISLMAVGKDVTKAKELEEEAAQRSMILKTALEFMPQGFAIFNSDQKIVAHNQKFLEMTGLPVDLHPLGMSHEEILRLRAKQGMTVERLTEEIIEKRIKGIVQDRESTNERVRDDGTIFIYHRSPLPFGGYVVTYTDITRVKRTEEQLHQSQKMQAIGQLTGGIAHDFNNLLAVIQGNADLLLDRLGPEDETANAIIKASERGAELTQRLLAFSRQQPLFPRPIDTNGLIHDMEKLLQRALGETVIVASTSVPDLWHIKVDRGQIESAILNLAINAKDAMPMGGKLTFDCANVRVDQDKAEQIGEMEPGDYVEIRITDTGVGMSAHVLNHAFEPFFTTKEVGKGTGLGLSMVYGFVKQSGGHVTIESGEAGGTTVTLLLPRAKEMAAADGEPHRSETLDGGQELVLVLEDDPAVCTTVKEILMALNYDVKTAHTSVQAEEILKREKISIVISDVILSGDQRGPDFAEKAMRLNPDLKFIFMSGYPSDLAGVEALMREGDILLRKPFARRELAAAMRRVLDEP